MEPMVRVRSFPNFDPNTIRSLSREDLIQGSAISGRRPSVGSVDESPTGLALTPDEPVQEVNDSDYGLNGDKSAGKQQPNGKAKGKGRNRRKGGR